MPIFFRNLLIFLGVNLFAISIAAAVPALSGWWWNPNESGSGYAIERQGDKVFMSAFLYEANGKPTWYATLMQMQADGSYRGDLTRYSGGKSLLGEHKAPTSTVVVATVSARFSFAGQGSLSFSFPDGSAARTIPINRFGFGSPAFAPSNGQFQNNWWWNDQESGTGYFVEVQGNKAFIASFMYDDEGQPVWYASLAELNEAKQLSGPLDTYRNGQSLRGTYRAPVVQPGAAGVKRYEFSGDARGTMILPNGLPVPIQRFIFDAKAAFNKTPVTQVGADISTTVGETVYLSGEASDPDGDPLTYSWHYLNAPRGSKAGLYNWQSLRPYFVPDIAGIYRFALVADDGIVSNDQSIITVTANSRVTLNRAPIARPGANQNITVGTPVILNGASSSDPDGDALSYSWTFQSRPSGSAAILRGATTVSPNFTADVSGTYVVSLTVSDGKLSSTPSTVSVNASALTPTGMNLVISEVSSCYYTNSNCWFEIYNPTASAINLANYTVKASSANLKGGGVAPQAYTLPSLVLQPNAYLVLASQSEKMVVQRGSQMIFLNVGDIVPYWRGSGFIELLQNNQTVDFVVFGSSSQNPSTTGRWNGAPVSALPSSADDYGKSIVRPYPAILNTNTRSSADWVKVDWVTPAGRNDIPPNTRDSDGDGIPDSAEQPGGTYGGLDLYAMGARTGRKDILIEIDRMNSNDPGLIPRRESLDKVVQAFATRGIHILFDAGTQFSTVFSPALYNLGQASNIVPYEACVGFDSTICTVNQSNRRTIYDWKQDQMDLRRRNVFHYLLMGNSQKADGSGYGSYGIAEYLGNDIIVTLGKSGLTTSAGIDLNALINLQAVAIMHELGHNLGLGHGGDSSQNYKPNYWSIMNYLYGSTGLDPNPAASTASDRWRREKGDQSPSYCNLAGSPCVSPSLFVIDYSDGSSAPLDETALAERDNIGRGSQSGAFADWDLNGSLTAALISKDLDGDGSKTVLRDFNDWGNLQLPFSRNWYGYLNGSSIQSLTTTSEDFVSNDVQRVVSDPCMMPRFR